MSRVVCVFVLFFASASVLAQAVPLWEERVLHQWINRARVDPATDLAGCGSNCSPAELDPSCYTPRPPLRWSPPLGTASRFHGESMARMNFFAHNTPCSLRQDLSSVYPSSCDGSSDCSCSGSGSTSASSRAGRFSGSLSGEIIAAGYSDPVSAFYGWLYEPVSSSTSCTYSSGGYNNTNGHRWIILKSSGSSVGTGVGYGGSWGRYYVGDFGNGGAAAKVVSGVHYPQLGSTLEFSASWHDAAAPSSAAVVVDGVSHALSLARGTASSGSWSRSVGGLGSGCHTYYFEFRDSSGATHRLPDSGRYGLGSGCPEWTGTPAAARGDFNGDAKPDLLWRNQSSGAVNAWFLDGSTYTGGASLFTVADANWRVAGAGDFNGDAKQDLVWRNDATGAVNVWFMNGTTYTGGANLFTVADSNWKIEGVGDFNGDSKDDLVWRHYGTGAVNVWFLDGTTYLGGSSLFTVADPNWEIEGTGDVNGDGKTDLVWRNYATGAVNVWYLDGTSYAGGASLFTVVDPNWKIEAIGDYSGDGSVDLIWRNSLTGAVNVWYLNGAVYAGGASLFTVADSNWGIAAPR